MKHPRCLFNLRGSRWGLIREGAYLKIQDQGYKKLARDIEERTGQESFYSQTLEIRNWQNYDEIHHEHSLKENGGG